MEEERVDGLRVIKSIDVYSSTNALGNGTEVSGRGYCASPPSRRTS